MNPGLRIMNFAALTENMSENRLLAQQYVSQYVSELLSSPKNLLRKACLKRRAPQGQICLEQLH